MKKDKKKKPPKKYLKMILAKSDVHFKKMYIGFNNSSMSLWVKLVYFFF